MSVAALLDTLRRKLGLERLNFRVDRFSDDASPLRTEAHAATAKPTLGVWWPTLPRVEVTSQRV